ncbi:hypothetical protein EVAR_67658_1 [Eumeta japonica]|uniref:Uncharacterized protein n=1 Tax=Eumeta variegata TaxID=151549 RepID=A0A4C1ZAV5_EUMVA|nr:hypothetical protein EVAR_67658_1 [Eumeta japonica]
MYLLNVVLNYRAAVGRCNGNWRSFATGDTNWSILYKTVNKQRTSEQEGPVHDDLPAECGGAAVTRTGMRPRTSQGTTTYSKPYIYNKLIIRVSATALVSTPGVILVCTIAFVKFKFTNAKKMVQTEYGHGDERDQSNCKLKLIAYVIESRLTWSATADVHFGRVKLSHAARARAGGTRSRSASAAS